MGKDHLKRLAAPKAWAVARKERTFITRPKPGRPFELAMPLNQVMKVLIQKGNTTKEVRYILHHEEVLVNGKQVRDHRRPVGFMDVVSFPATKESFVISLSKKGKLIAVPLEGKMATRRIAKIKGKTRIASKMQINCYDGTNITVDKDSYKVGDSVIIENGKIVKHLPLASGATIVLTGGRHQAAIGAVKEVDGRTIIFTAQGEEMSTARRHAYVVGEKESEVTLR